MKPTSVSEHALILAPRGRDAAIAVAVLEQAGVGAYPCSSLAELVQELDCGAGLVVVTEEALTTADLGSLAAWITNQEEWSDLTFVLLTNPAGAERNPAARRYLDVLGNATLVERPFHPTTLISSVKSALRARRRQYEARARLEELRESETRLRLATEHAEIGFWDVDPVNDALIWPARVKAMFGISPAAPVTMQDFYAGLHPDDREATASAYAAAADPHQRALYDVEYRTIGKEDGVVRWVAAKGRGLFDEAGRCVRVIGTAVDVTRRKTIELALRTSEARLSFLDRLSAATAPLSDADAVLAATTRLLGEHLGVSVCAYADMDEDEDGFTIRGDWSAPGSVSIVGHYRLADFGRLAVANLSAGQPLVVNDNLSELAPEEAATFQSIGITATICMPLVKDGRLRALMAIHHNVPHAWTDDELALLREVTERSWAHVERVGSEAMLRESNARFEAAVRAVEGVVWTNDADGRMTGEQAGWEALTGQSREQYEGFGWAAVVHPADAEATLLAWQAAVAERRPFIFEHRLRRWDGVWRTFAVRAIPTFASDGAVLEWVGVHTDVTVHRRTEGQLRELNSTLEQRVSEALAERRILAKIVETTKAHIQVIDTNYRWLAVNRSCAAEYARIYGKRPIVGECLLDLLADQPEELQAAKAVWDRSLSGVAFTQTAEFGDPARDRRHYEMTFEALRDGAGVQIGSFMTGINITERVREQARLAEAEEALRQSQKMDAMGQLTGGVAHDFNNLLMPIIAGLDMLQRKGVGDPRSQRMVDGALQSAERAKTLVQRLLAFARRQPLQPQAVDVGSLIHGMVDLLASTVGPRIELALDVASDLPRAVADANQLEMALLNLAVNARDAMPEGGKLTIALGAENLEHTHGWRLPPGAYLRLCVHDTGVGMDEVTRLKATEPFFSTKGIGRGTGLGLSMVHGLAAQLGGALTIESAPGEGTTIKIWLPLALHDAVASIPSTDPATSPRSGTVLLVDDEALVRSSTSEMLGDLGFRVIEAESGEEALRRLDEEISIDVLITDHLMPGMTGTQLIGAARHRRAGLPVLLISGYADVEGIAPELDRLTKPFRQSELAAVVAKLLPSG